LCLSLNSLTYIKAIYYEPTQHITQIYFIDKTMTEDMTKVYIGTGVGASVILIIIFIGIIVAIKR